MCDLNDLCGIQIVVQEKCKNDSVLLITVIHNRRIIQEENIYTNNEIILLYFIENKGSLEWISQLFQLCIRRKVLYYLRINIKLKVSGALMVE